MNSLCVNSESSGAVAAVQLCRVDLDDFPVGRAPSVLADDELARATRMRFARDRRRFLAGRIALRAVLADRLGAEPGGLQFMRNAWGKPALVDEAVKFNVTNADGIALIALAVDDVGIDLEPTVSRSDHMAVAQTVFSPAELRELASTSPDQLSPAFLRGWTRKEAVVKAMGNGLAAPLDRFSVSLSSEAEMTWCGFDDAGAWQLLDISDAVPGYTAALALRVPALAVTSVHIVRATL